MATIGNYIHYRYKNYEKEGTTQLVHSSNFSSGPGIINNQITSAKAKIKSRQNKNQNFQSLETILNNIIYPKTPEQKEETEIYRQRTEAAMIEKLQGHFINWYAGGAVHKNPQGKNASAVAGRLQSISEQMKQALQDLTLNPDKEKEQKIRSIIATLEQIQVQSNFAQDPKGSTRRISAISKNGVNLIAELNQKLTGLANNARNARTGDVLEVLLASLDQRLPNKITKKSIDLINNTLVVGSQHDKVKVSKISANITKELGEINLTEELGDGHISIKTSGDLSSTYKADVNLFYDNTHYKISAKNYYLGDKSKTIHFLSNSPFLNILRKNATADYINHYLNIVTTKGNEKSNLLEQAHQATKLTIILEALSGLSQKHGYSDTLVINNRSQKKVIVKSMSEILSDIELNQEIYFSGIEGYNINNSYNTPENIDKPNNNLAWRRIARLLAKVQADKISYALDTSKLSWFK